VIKPSLSAKNASAKYASALANLVPDEKFIGNDVPDDVAKLNTLRELHLPVSDITPHETLFSNLVEDNKSAEHIGTIEDTQQVGGYRIQLHVEGTNPETGRSFSRTKLLGTLVTDD